MYTVRPIKIKPAISDDPINLFLSTTSDIKSTTRSVCFYRIIGIDCDDKNYIEKIKQIDESAEKLPAPYLRLSKLAAPSIQEASELETVCRAWIKASSIPEAAELPFPVDFCAESLNFSLHRSFFMLLQSFSENISNNKTIHKNFCLKMIYWIKRYLTDLLSSAYFPKLLFTGKPSGHDSLFFMYCASIGIDVLYLNPSEDFPETLNGLYKQSCLVKIGTQRELTLPIPEYSGKIATEKLPAGRQNPIQAPTASSAAPNPPARRASHITASEQTRELSYEELAAFSGSVVLIYAFNENKEFSHSGSGVVINDRGFIVTNCHVISGAAYYSIRFENDEQEYLTDSIIKYHSNFDLAVLRVDRATAPIRLKTENELRRGQKVVAIGSPHGLFNSVSDGIISGFRQINNGVDMIQFTAPSSNGSSGGALMDMYGNLIGIIQSGFHDGLTLAVSHNIIYDFIRPFLK